MAGFGDDDGCSTCSQDHRTRHADSPTLPLTSQISHTTSDRGSLNFKLNPLAGQFQEAAFIKARQFWDHFAYSYCLPFVFLVCLPLQDTSSI